MSTAPPEMEIAQGQPGDFEVHQQIHRDANQGSNRTPDSTQRRVPVSQKEFYRKAALRVARELARRRTRHRVELWAYYMKRWLNAPDTTSVTEQERLHLASPRKR